ncbi:MAG: hypothetical protein V1822_01065 [Candidatus Micrarchaeota archaeon]
MITQQTIHVLLTGRNPVWIPAAFLEIKDSLSPIKKISAVQWPSNLLNFSSPPSSSQEVESRALQLLSPGKSMGLLLEAFGISSIEIREGQASFSKEEGSLRLPKQGLLGLAFMASNFGDLSKRVCPSLIGTLSNADEAPASWSAKEGVFSLLLHVAHHGIDGLLQDLTISPEGAKWLRQRALSASGVIIELYPLQLEAYKLIYGGGKEA